MLQNLYTSWRNSYLGIPRPIWFLAFVNLVNRCGSMVIGFITIYLTQQLQFGIEQAGYIMGFFGIGAFAGAYIGGRLTDRIGYYHVQFSSLILNGLALWWVFYIHEFHWMCVAIFTMSLVGEMFRPANSVAIVRNSAPENRTRSISLMRMAFNLGWTVAPVFGGLLVAFGWKWLFWIDGITCILAALLLRWVLPPQQQVGAPEPARNAEGEAVVAGSPLRDGPFLFFLFATLIGAMVFMQFLWTVPVFFKEQYHWEESTIGIMTAINGALVFMVEMPLIFRIENRRPLLYFVRIGLVLYGLSYLSFAAPMAPFQAALSYLVLISFGEILVMPFSSNFMYGRSKHGNQGQYTAMYSIAYSVANILAPLLGTQIIAHAGYHTLWYVLGGMSLAALGMFWYLQAWLQQEK
jgi:predicted MFS family arabinose efflux permease